MTQSTFHDGPRSDRQRAQQSEDDMMIEDPRVAHERNAERERAEQREQARERAENARAGEQPSHAFGTSYLGNSTDQHWQEWRQIQANFVDNPRSAVSDAHALVGRMLDDIVHRLEGERNQLEQRWSSGQDVGTEELRRCLQTYRDFFGRLLANVGDGQA